jgi:hypothetical protein
MEVKGNFINYGSYVDVHDNEVVNLSIDGNGEVKVDRGERAEQDDERQQELVEKLKPIFFGDETEARAFLTSIAGMKPTQITDRVNQLAKEKKISEMSKHRDLWRVLHDAGLYDKSESNWNAQVE